MTSIIVNVSALRNEIDHVFQVCTDFHACVDANERASWVVTARKVVASLQGMTCKRATARDTERREAALARANELISKVQG